MSEADDRLGGDPVWELYPARPAVSRRSNLLRKTLAAMPGIGIGLMVWPPLAIMTICFVAGWEDFDQGRRFTREVTDLWARAVLARFQFAWGFLKVGTAAFVLLLGSIFLAISAGRVAPPDIAAPPEFMMAFVLMILGFSASAGLTSAGLRAAFRGGMRVWIGEGINQARTLLLSMMMVGFIGAVLLPICALMVAFFDPQAKVAWPFFVLMGSVFVGPVLMLLIVDAVDRRVIAASPTKFGPKVSSVGKWPGSTI